MYLNRALKLVTGKTIDFGCGIGEMLQRLPSGSIGLEINKSTVDYCKQKKVNIQLYHPDKDNYQLSEFKPSVYDTLLISHVLEHLEQPEIVIRSLLTACTRLSIKKIVIIVPGKKGFSFDKTHKTFINSAFFRNNNLNTVEKFQITKQQYFPFNIKQLETLFTHHELQVTYCRKS
ncbi:class I SAM-dependent methyltransferase [bacterium]|nr:class I SAM-dependent methyltransferase [bacterium]